MSANARERGGGGPGWSEASVGAVWTPAKPSPTFVSGLKEKVRPDHPADRCRTVLDGTTRPDRMDRMYVVGLRVGV